MIKFLHVADRTVLVGDPIDAGETPAGLRRIVSIPPLIYFRSTPRFEISDKTYGWLTSHIFMGAVVRHLDRVALAVYPVI